MADIRDVMKQEQYDIAMHAYFQPFFSSLVLPVGLLA